MKGLVLLGVAVLMTTAVMAERERRAMRERPLHSEHNMERDHLRSERPDRKKRDAAEHNMERDHLRSERPDRKKRDTAEHNMERGHLRSERPDRKKRDTAKQTSGGTGLLGSVPKDTIQHYLIEALAKVNAAKAADSTKSATDIVVDYILEKLVEDGAIDKSNAPQVRTEMGEILEKRQFEKNLDKIMKHHEIGQSNQHHTGSHSNPHHRQVAEQHPESGHSNPQHHQGTAKTQQHQTNRDDGNHDIPVKSESGDHHQGRRPEHTMGTGHHQNEAGHSQAHHQNVAHNHNNNGGVNHSPEMTREMVKGHINHFVKAVHELEDEEETERIMQELASHVQGMKQRDNNHHSQHHQSVSSHISEDEVKAQLNELLDTISSSGNDSHSHLTLNTVLHILHAFAVHENEEKGGHHQHSVHEDPSVDYVRGYAMEVIDRLEAHHNKEEVKKALAELSHALHLTGLHHGTKHSNVTMAFVRKYANEVFNGIKHHHNQTEAQTYLSIIAHYVFTFLDHNKATEGLHQHHEGATFDEMLETVRTTTFKLFDNLEAQLNGQELHDAIKEIVHMLTMVEIKSMDKAPLGEHHTSKVAHVTPDTVGQDIIHMIDQCSEEELEVLLHEITTFLHAIEVELPNYHPHHNSAKAIHEASSHATPDTVKALAVDVVDDLVSRYDGEDLRGLMTHMTELLEHIKIHGTEHQHAQQESETDDNKAKDETQSVLGLGTSLLPDLGLTGASSGFDAAPAQDGANVAIPSRTFGASDDHFRSDMKSGHVGHTVGGPQARHRRRK